MSELDDDVELDFDDEIIKNTSLKRELSILDEYEDTDLENDEDTNRFLPDIYDKDGKNNVYSKKLLNLETKVFSLNYRNLNIRDMRIFCKALKGNRTVEELNLKSNNLNGGSFKVLCEALNCNPYVSKLNISANQPGKEGSIALSNMLTENNSIIDLDLSENKLMDEDIRILMKAFESNDRVQKLNLSLNNFDDKGATYIGNMLTENNSIEKLDLSWNSLRRKGAVSIITGIKCNLYITWLDLSWNGLGYEGCVALSDMIKSNKYLKYLDVSNNRIDWKCCMLLAKGLKNNMVLETLKIGFNPLTMTGIMDIFDSINQENSLLNNLSMKGIPISKKIQYTAELILRNRTFKFDHGGVIDSEDVLGRRIISRGDPFKLLIQFLTERAIRPMDLFKTFDKDNNHKVSRDHFIMGLKKAKVPLDESEMQRVMNRLDTSKEGRISYQRLIVGVKEHLLKERELLRNEITEKEKLNEYHKNILNSEDKTDRKFPHLISNSMVEVVVKDNKKSPYDSNLQQDQNLHSVSLPILNAYINTNHK